MPIEQRLTRPGIPLHSEFVGGESDTIREIPPEWRAAFDLIVEQIPMPWDRPIVELSDTVLASKAEQQFTSERMMRTTYKPPGVFHLFESYTDRHKQLGVRDKSFHFITDWPSVVPNPSALTDVETRNFGNKHFELRVDSVPDVFGEESFCEERPVVTPLDFRALLGENEHCITELGQATAPPDPMPTGVIKWCDNNVDFFTHRVCIREIDTLHLPAEIDNKETNRYKQFVDVRRFLELDTTTPMNPTSTVDVEFTKLGDGTALEVQKDVGTIFPQFRYERTRPVVTPPEFRAKLQEQQTDFTTDVGHASPPAALPAGFISVTDTDETLFTHRFAIRQIDVSSLPQNIYDRDTNRFKQSVLIQKTLMLDTGFTVIPSAYQDVKYTSLGDGTAVQETRETRNPTTDVAEVFDEHSAATEIADLVPEIFKAVLPIVTEDSVVISTTITDPPVLATGDLYREEKRETEFTVRIKTRGRNGLSLPDSKVASREIAGEQFGGEIFQTTAYLDSSEPPVETGLGVLSSEVRNLGNGLFVRQTQKFDTALFWPTILDSKFDEKIQNRIVIEKQVVDPSYTPLDGTYYTEALQGIDQWKARRIRTTKDVSAHHDKASAIISYRYHPFQFPGTLDYNRLITFSHREGYRRSAALLAKHTIRTWWISSSTPPVVGDADLGTVDVDVKEIISDTVNVPVYATGNDTEAQTYPEVLHDNITNTLGAFYPATTPSLTEYYLGTPSGSTGTFGVGAGQADGTSYVSGDTISAGGFSFTVLTVGTGGSLSALAPSPAPPTGIIITGFTSLGIFAASGGSGSGGHVNVFQVTYDTPVPGSMWVGTEKPIAADVKPTDIPNLWEVTTESVVMR